MAGWVILILIFLVICYCLVIKLVGQVDMLEGYNRVLWDRVNYLTEENDKIKKVLNINNNG